MKEGQSSRTAEAAAALRANHYLFSDNPVFSDPYAFEMTSPAWRKLLKTSLVTKVINSAVFNRTLGLLTGQVVGRARYAEDLLEQAVNQDIRQYVLVGAGLDSFALRQARHYPDLTLFEVDHPATQQLKREKLQKLGSIPDNLEFVSIDFEKESLADALARSSYLKDSPAFYAWLGTTHYLQPATTLATLQSIAHIAAPLSEVVLDYSIDYRELQGIERFGSQFVSQFTRFLKEPLLGQFRPQQLHQAVEQMGFKVLEDLSGEGLSERYFHDRPDHIRHTVATHMLHLQLNSSAKK